MYRRRPYTPEPPHENSLFRVLEKAIDITAFHSPRMTSTATDTRA